MKSFKNLFLLFVLAMTALACKQSQAVTDNSEDTTPEQTAVELPKGETFGEAFQATELVAFNDLTTALSDGDSITTSVVGTVESVCQMKGCWMNIANEGVDSEMMVKFKDYGFFMPKDIAGREVVMNGVAYYETTSVDELRHYAEDAGKSEEEIAAITEPKKELKFMASGVVLVDEE